MGKETSKDKNTDTEKKEKKTVKKKIKKKELARTCPNCKKVRHLSYGKLKCYAHHKLTVTPQDFCDNFEKV